MVINLGKNRAFIGAYKVTIEVNAKQWGQFFVKRLLTNQESGILPYLEAVAPLIRVLQSNNRDFLFYSTPQANLTLYSHIVNHETLKILVKNASDRIFCVSY